MVPLLASEALQQLLIRLHNLSLILQDLRPSQWNRGTAGAERPSCAIPGVQGHLWHLTAVNDQFAGSAYINGRRLTKKLALSTKYIKVLTNQINNHLQSCLAWCELQDPNKALKALGRSEDLLSQLYQAILNHSKATLTASRP